MSNNKELKEFQLLVNKTMDAYPEPKVRGSEEIDSAMPTTKEKAPETLPKMWAVAGDEFFPCETAVDILPPGQYIIRYSNNRGVYFSKKTVNLDSLIDLPDNNSQKVLESINDFWDREDNFREFGFLWKRGILVWGPPGGGKTSTVQQLSKLLIDRGGLSIYCTDPGLDAAGLEMIRRIEPDRPIVVILEDIDAIISSYGETNLLALLDGELQIDNVVFIATTNYPERLDKRFINRPSRFDEIIKIGMPSAEARKSFLEHKNPRLNDDPEGLKYWISKTEGYSIAHLKELIVSVECFGRELDSVIERLDSMINRSPKSDEDNLRSIGFGSQNK